MTKPGWLGLPSLTGVYLRCLIKIPRVYLDNPTFEFQIEKIRRQNHDRSDTFLAKKVVLMPFLATRFFDNLHTYCSTLRLFFTLKTLYSLARREANLLAHTVFKSFFYIVNSVLLLSLMHSFIPRKSTCNADFLGISAILEFSSRPVLAKAEVEPRGSYGS